MIYAVDPVSFVIGFFVGGSIAGTLGLFALRHLLIKAGHRLL